MAGEVSFASFNLYNFQAVGQKVYGKIVEQAPYNRKRDWTREQVKVLDADVIAFQELWSRSCLEDVFNDPDLEGYELTFINNDGDPPWYGIAVALAVRKPWRVSRKENIKKFPFENITKIDEGDGEDDEVDVTINRFSRTIIDAHLVCEGNDDLPEINLLAAHLKAKLPTRVDAITKDQRRAIGSAISTIRRTAEAAALRWVLTEKMKATDTPIVLLGDLNDDPRSNTLALITEQPSLAPTSRGGDTALYSALQMQQLQSYRDVFYTHEYNRLKDTLDHILVSEQFFGASSDAIWRHVDTKVWNDFIGDKTAHTSDHGVIRAAYKPA